MSNHRDARTIVQNSLSAHGGETRWSNASTLRTRLRLGGPALLLKGRSPLQRSVSAEVDLHRPEARLEIDGRRYHMRGFHIERLDGDGRVTRRTDVEVKNGVQHTPRLWSDLDEAHFIGYATWNYGLGPWLLLQGDVELELLSPIVRRGRTYERIRARYGDDIPTHCPVQDFWFDHEGRLARLDYIAHALAPWARGGHEVASYREFDGLLMTERRRVWLRPFGGLMCARILPALWGRILEAQLMP